MKILVSRTSPDTIGGAELSAFDQTVVLNELGHEAVLATNLKYLKERARVLGIKTYWMPWVNRGPLSVPIVRYITFVMSLPIAWIVALVLALRIKPDIINAHSREDQIAFTLSKWIHRRPVVWKDPGDLRAHMRNMSKGGFIKNIYLKIQLRAIQKADHIYLLNQEDVENLAKYAGKEIKQKCNAIPSSILYRYYNRNAEKIEKPWGTIVVGSIVRLDELKGVQFLIEAAKRVKCDSRIEFWQINDQGIYAAELYKMAEGLDCFKFFPTTTDISKYLCTFDVFVHPVLEEGWGRSVKEAMYFGLPVIGSRVGGVKLQIEDGKTGFLFKPGDVKELARLLNKFIADKELRRRIGLNAKRKAEADGDFVKIVREQIIPIYQDVLGIGQ